MLYDVTIKIRDSKIEFHGLTKDLLGAVSASLQCFVTQGRMTASEFNQVVTAYGHFVTNPVRMNVYFAVINTGSVEGLLRVATA